MNTRAIKFLILIITFITACTYNNGFRNIDEINLSSSDSIQNVIREMDILINLLPEANTPSRHRYYTISKDGQIEINNITISNIHIVSTHDFICNKLLEHFSEQGKLRFLQNIKILYKNNVTGAVVDIANWQYNFYYKCYFGDDVNSIRKLKYCYQSSDSTNSIFKQEHIVLDKKDNLILFMFKARDRNINNHFSFIEDSIPRHYIDSLIKINNWGSSN